MQHLSVHLQSDDMRKNYARAIHASEQLYPKSRKRVVPLVKGLKLKEEVYTYFIKDLSLRREMYEKVLTGHDLRSERIRNSNAVL